MRKAHGINHAFTKAASAAADRKIGQLFRHFLLVLNFRLLRSDFLFADHGFSANLFKSFGRGEFHFRAVHRAYEPDRRELEQLYE